MNTCKETEQDTLAAESDQHLEVGTRVEKPIGWCLGENEEALHKRITDRFEELLNLFEDYSTVVSERSTSSTSTLKRSQSDQLFTRYQHASNDHAKTSVSASEIIITQPSIKRKTCEVGIQTTRTLSKESMICDNSLALVPVKDERMVLIHVEPELSDTVMFREPLYLRLWHVLTTSIRTFGWSVYVIGSNFAYVLAVALCGWCVYFILAHFYGVMSNGVKRQYAQSN